MLGGALDDLPPQTRGFLEPRGEVRTAYRDVLESAFNVLWPDGLTHFDVK